MGRVRVGIVSLRLRGRSFENHTCLRVGEKCTRKDGRMLLTAILADPAYTVLVNVLLDR